MDTLSALCAHKAQNRRLHYAILYIQNKKSLDIVVPSDFYCNILAKGIF